jgi:3-hydroxyacyl-[acyl-carrier-protein] dehydratase
MRWIWIDRFVEFESGRRAVAIKNLSLAEEHLHDHFPGNPVMPGSLIIEGLAQTGGLLVGEARGFEEKVILAKIPKMTFHGLARPGETLTYTATIDYIQDDGAMVTVTSHVGDRLQAEGEIVFAHLNDGRERRQFEPKNFVFTLKLLGVFDVGQSDGSAAPYPPGVERLRAKSER